jgi:hypothetical protein
MSSPSVFAGQEALICLIAAFGHGTPTPQVIAAGIDEEPVTTIACAFAYTGAVRGGHCAAADKAIGQSIRSSAV